MYGEPTDPMPFLLGAYILGIVLIGGYGLWIWAQRKQVQKYLAALQSDGKVVEK